MPRWLLIGILALVVRLLMVAAWPGLVPVSPDLVDRYDPIAESLLRGEGFALGGRPTAISPPAFPLLLAATRSVFGDSRTAFRAVLSALDAVTCVIWFFLVRRLFDDRLAGLVGVGLALCPYLIFAVYVATSDTLFLLLHSVAVLLAVLLSERPSGRLAFATGIAFAAATLCRAVPLLLPAMLIPAVIVSARLTRRAGVRVAAGLVSGFVLALLPWTVRNAAIFHRFVPVQTLGGYHAFLATTDLHDPRTWETLRAERHSGESAVQSDASMYDRAWNRIERDPVEFVKLAAGRLVSMWYASHSGALKKVLLPVNGALLALGAVGVILMRRRWRQLLPLYAVFAYYVGLHSVILAIFRYLLPIVPILVTFAAVPIAALLDRRRKSVA